MTAALTSLRETLARRFPDALPLRYRTAITVATGNGRLDGLLPNGGLPRGRLSVWAPGGGATAVLQSACTAVTARGERAAWVDGAGTVQGDFWRAGPLLLRPGSEVEALVCAEELLRSGGFSLVVLAGCGRGAEREAVRLSRSAREGGSAFVVVGPEVAVASLRVASHVPVNGYRWRLDPFGEPAEVESVRVEVEARSLGWSGRTSFRLAVLSHAPRAALDPLLVDRRGATRTSSRSGRRRQRSGA